MKSRTPTKSNSRRRPLRNVDLDLRHRCATCVVRPIRLYRSASAGPVRHEDSPDSAIQWHGGQGRMYVQLACEEKAFIRCSRSESVPSTMPSRVAHFVPKSRKFRCRGGPSAQKLLKHAGCTCSARRSPRLTRSYTVRRTRCECETHPQRKLRACNGQQAKCVRSSSVLQPDECRCR